MKILFLGSGVFHDLNYRALLRNGHEVTQIDPDFPWRNNWFTWRWVYETGGVGLLKLVELRILRLVNGMTFDLVWVGSGPLIGPGLLQKLRKHAPIILNYNPDNPYVSRDRRLWETFKRAVGEYDLMVTSRRATALEAYKYGAKRTLFEWFCADEMLCLSASALASDWGLKQTEVVFIGTWMPERGPFLCRLLDLGVPLRIFGQRWWRAPEYWRLRSAVVPGPVWGQKYAEVIARAKIALALLSEGNEDLHTTRSVEIPAIGTLMCAKRTTEHLELYDEETEAVFWNDADECAEKCLSLLKDEAKIKAIANAGHVRALRNNNFYQVLVERIIQEAAGL